VFVVKAPAVALHLVVLHHKFKHSDVMLRFTRLDAQLGRDCQNVFLMMMEPPVEKASLLIRCPILLSAYVVLAEDGKNQLLFDILGKQLAFDFPTNTRFVLFILVHPSARREPAVALKTLHFAFFDNQGIDEPAIKLDVFFQFSDMLLVEQLVIDFSLIWLS